MAESTAGRPRIGITAWRRPLPTPLGERTDLYTLGVEYAEAVQAAGGLALILPHGDDPDATLATLDGLLLSGGGDVDPDLYGGRTEHPQLYGVHKERDATELELARAALEAKLPTLGICRGCQVINVAFGGSLIEHLPDEVGDGLAHRGVGPGTSSLHPVELTPGSRVAAIVGELRPRTASSHHQALRRVAQGLEVVAWAADGTIEAVERADHPFYLAVQWHPEETAAVDPGQQRLFDALAAAAIQYRGTRT